MVDISTPGPPTPAHAPEAQVLLNYFSQFVELSPRDIKEILAMSLPRVRTYPKGTLLLREGQRGDTCYFVLKGCVRQYYLIDGEEKTTNFFTEGQPVNSSGIPFDTLPSKAYLSCLEACTLMEGKPGDEQDFFEKVPVTQTISIVAVEFELRKSQETLAEYITTSPEARYLNLMKTRPELIDRVPQYQLASYLGITPESLSRIRKRIMTK